MSFLGRNTLPISAYRTARKNHMSENQSTSRCVIQCTRNRFFTVLRFIQKDKYEMPVRFLHADIELHIHLINFFRMSYSSNNGRSCRYCRTTEVYFRIRMTHSARKVSIRCRQRAFSFCQNPHMSTKARTACRC